MKKESEGLSLFKEGGTEVTLEEVRTESLMALCDRLAHEVKV